MKTFGMKIVGGLSGCLLGLMVLAQPGRPMAQAPAAGMANIHGHVNNAAGQPVTGAVVRLTTDKNAGNPNRKFEYEFPLDSNGDYKGADVKPANYLGVVMQGPKTLDFMPAPLAAGEDKTLDFDMTRKEYMDKMSPADRAQLEEFKKKNAEVVANNAKIGNLNALLKQARADTQSGNYASAVKAMTDATAAKPDEALLWITLGDAQLGLANAAAKVAHDSKVTDASLPEKYQAAATSYQKSLSLNAAVAKPVIELTGAANNQLGDALGKMALVVPSDKRADALKDSVAAYEAAAKADPKGAAKYYFNEAVMLYNASLTTGKVDGIADAADKVIAIDPTKTEAYYLKSQALAAGITTTPDGKFIPPAGLVEAINKYLELAPTGPHAADLKGLLAGLGEQIKTNYKAPGKSTKK